MDLKGEKKSLKYQERPHITSRYFESNAGQLFVSNVNPFNSVGDYAGNVKENHITKEKHEEFIGIFGNSTKEHKNMASKALVTGVIDNYPFNRRNLFMNEPYDEIHEALMHDDFVAENQRPERLFSQPAISSSLNLIDTQYMTSSSRGVPKSSRYCHQVRFEESNEDNNRHTTYSSKSIGPMDPIVPEKGRAEKTTYCRPLCNMYNQEFVYKTMQRNARLQKLVRKLVIARETEKQREAWNNYINDLKNKHQYYSNEPSRISPQYVPEENNTPGLVDDFYNTRFNWNQSNPCQHLLHDLYGNNNNMPPNTYSRYLHDYDSRPPSNLRPNIYDNYSFCYPTSSQANLLKLNRERYGNNFAYEWRNRPSGRYFRGGTILAEKEPKGNFDRIQGTTRVRYGNSKLNICTNGDNLGCIQPSKDCKCTPCVNQTLSKPIQTDLPLDSDRDEYTSHKKETLKEKFKRVTGNIAKLKSKMRHPEEESRKDSLAHIEDKIDNLIQSINTIMVDIKSKKSIYHRKKSASVSCNLKVFNVAASHNNLNRPNSDPYSLMKNEEYLCGVVQHSSRSLTLSEVASSHLSRRRESSVSKMDKIILEEMKKSNKVKRDIEELLNLRSDRNCSVQITFDIPTRERSTEVTDSLSRARLESVRNVVVEEIPSEDPSDRRNAQMTIAVNTDPLGLLALLRVSTETIKQLLSYMPNLNYNSCLSMLQLPSRRCVSHYICNICGAAFGRPSQLSDHIEQHNLGRTR